MQKVHKNRGKSDENGIQKASQKASRASKMSPAASRRRPRASKKRPGGAKLDLVVFYSVFKRPRSPGGKSGGALITYWLGRLTELNNIQTSTFSAHLRSNLLPSNTHWCAGGHGADLLKVARGQSPPPPHFGFWRSGNSLG